MLSMTGDNDALLPRGFVSIMGALLFRVLICRSLDIPFVGWLVLCVYRIDKRRKEILDGSFVVMTVGLSREKKSVIVGNIYFFSFLIRRG